MTEIVYSFRSVITGFLFSLLVDFNAVTYLERLKKSNKPVLTTKTFDLANIFLVIKR